MTVSSTVSRWEYVGNASATNFAYNNKIFADTDLLVYIDGTLKTLTTDYTVTGAGDDGGGDVVFVSAPATDTEVVILRNVPNTQASDFPAGGAFPSSTVENALDRLTIVNQQQQEAINRSLKFASTDQALPSAELPALSTLKNMLLAFDASGNPYGQDPNSTMLIPIEDFDLNGGTLTIDLDADTTMDSATDDRIDFNVGGERVLRVQNDGTTNGKLELRANEADANAGPSFVAYRDSASPADADAIGQYRFDANSDASTQRTFVTLQGRIVDASDGTEDGGLTVKVMLNGTLAEIADFLSGHVTFTSNDAGGLAEPTLTLHRDSVSPADNDQLGNIDFDGNDDGATQTTYARLQAIALDVTNTTEAGALAFSMPVAGTMTEIMRAASPGALLLGKTASNENAAGVELNTNGHCVFTRAAGIPVVAHRISDDGTLISLMQGGAEEGAISVAGNTVSYNTFTGAHWAQWGSGAEPPSDPPEGTLLSTVDEPYERQLAVNAKGIKRRLRPGTNPRANEHAVNAPKPQLVKCKITDQQADRRVYGTFGGRTEDGDVQVYALGTVMVRVTGPAAGGDLIQASATPGVAEVQSDDVIRSSTVGKLSMGDALTGERLLPAALYCG